MIAVPDTGDVARGLYALPLDQFTSARNELVKKLRSQGRRAQAEEVKSLRKPSVSVWAVNQLAHRHGKQMRELLELRERIEKLRSADELRATAEQRRDLIAQMLESARSILLQAGHNDSAATMQRIGQTLYAGATEQERRALVEGTLTNDLEPSGFGQALAVEATPGVQDMPAPQRHARAEAERLEQEAEAAEREAERLERDAARAETSARRARTEAQAAAKAAERARERAQRARAQLG